MKKLIQIKELLNIIFLVVFLILAFGIGYLIFQNISLKQQLQNKSSIIKQKEEDLQLCLQNKARVVEDYRVAFSPQEFGLYSPLFENKEISVRILSFKGNAIKEMEIELLPNAISLRPVTVKVWDYVDVSFQNIARFDEYYNATPLWMINFSEDRLDYVSSMGIRMKRACGKLSFYKELTSIHSVYVEIFGEKCLGLYAETAEQAIKESTKNLEEIADTITF